MPTYQFRNLDTGEEFERFMSISARETYLEENPNIISILSTAPALGDPVRLGIRKVDGGFKEVLQKIKARAPGSTMNI